MEEISQFEPLVRATAASVRASTRAAVAREDLEQIGRLELLKLPQADLSAAYLRAVLRNSMISAIRGRAWRDATTISLTSTIWSPEAASGAALDPLLERAIARLPARQAEVMRLRFLEGMSQREAAKAMGVGRDRARRLEYAALRKLRSARRSPVRGNSSGG